LRSSVALLTALLVAGVPAAFHAQSSTDARDLTPGAFLVEIDALIERIDAVADAAGATAAAASVPDQWRVASAGEHIEIDTRWVKSLLADTSGGREGWSARREVVRRRLIHAREHVAAHATGDRDAARARAHEAAQSILARGEFQQSAASRWRERMQERVGKWFEDLFARLGAGRTAGRTTALAFAWAAALAALAGLGFWLARTLAARPHGAALNLGYGSSAQVRARELALRALAEARAGNAREAVRGAYHAAIVRLEEEGAWRVDEARTPREYLRMLRATDSRHPLMLDLTRRFERIWYGNRPAAADDTTHVTAHLETLGCLRPGERAI
jgi:Domain of unknown function (DUF4129)